MLIFLPFVLPHAYAMTRGYIHFVGGYGDEMVHEIAHTHTSPRNSLGGRKNVDQHTTRGNKCVRQVRPEVLWAAGQVNARWHKQ